MVGAMEEFAAELEKVQRASRFRVDRVSGKNNYRRKAERIRSNDADKKARADCRNVYSSNIKPEE